MNIYRWRFHAKCPNNGHWVTYRAKLRTDRTIMVEDLLKFTSAVQEGYHEKIADSLFAEFGGRQTVRAFHHGVEISTKRGWRE